MFKALARRKTHELCSYMSLKIKLHVLQMPLTVETAEIYTTYISSDIVEERWQTKEEV